MELKELINHSARRGSVDWIGLRPGKRQQLMVAQSVRVSEELGIEGDHYGSKRTNRQVTLIQAEHLVTVSALLGRETPIDPHLTRRNLVVSGLNLLSLQNRQFRIGSDVVLQGTGTCPPCERMEENLGYGGYNAMIGHGGITAKVIVGGTVRLGDDIVLLPTSTEV